MTQIGSSELDVFPLSLGTNVFGWTADKDTAFELLDSYVAGGGNLLDTADSYPPRQHDGTSEAFIGEWLSARGARDKVMIATKVGKQPDFLGLSPETIRGAAEASLSRLKTDHIDLYYAHEDDPKTPLEETLAAFDALIQEGKVRYIGASNYSAPRLAEALAVSRQEGLPGFVAVQPPYNLIDRAEYELELRPVCLEWNLSCIPYWSLARGFLTGKYRPGEPIPDTPRAGFASTYLEGFGEELLSALDDLAAAHDASVAAVALAWLREQPTVAAALSSATTVEQLQDLLGMAAVPLSAAELGRLSAITDPATQAAPTPGAAGPPFRPNA